MKTRLALIVSMVILTACNAQKVKGNRDVTIESKDTQPFTHLIVDEDFEIELIQSNRTYVDIETDSNLHEHIFVSSVSNTLDISKTANIRGEKRLKVTVYCNELLEKITISGNGKLRGQGRISTERLEINLLDDGEINLSVNSKDLVVHANKSTRAELEASGDMVQLHASQNAFFKMNLDYNQAQITMDHRSDAEISGNVNNGSADLKENSHLRSKGLTWDNLQITARHDSKAEISVKDDLIISAIDDAELTIYNSPKIQIEKFTDKAVLKKQD